MQHARSERVYLGPAHCAAAGALLAPGLLTRAPAALVGTCAHWLFAALLDSGFPHTQFVPFVCHMPFCPLASRFVRQITLGSVTFVRQKLPVVRPWSCKLFSTWAQHAQSQSRTVARVAR